MNRIALQDSLIRLAIVAVFVLAWQVAADQKWINPFFVSTPREIGKVAWTWLLDGTYLKNVAVTLEAALAGFALGAVSGVLLGSLFGRMRRAGDILQPLMNALYTLPRLALAPLFVLWFGIGLQFKIVFAALIVFFLVYYSTFSGVRDVPGELVAAVRVMGARRLEILRKVIFPSALVWVVSGLRVSVPYALVGVIVGEMLVSNEGLGYLVISNSNQYNASAVFAAILALLVIGLVLDSALTRFSHRALRWKTSGALQ